MEIKGVKIGDIFAKNLSKGKYSICEVVDLVERRSMKTGKVIDIECWAKSMDGKFSPNNSFQVAFATAKLGKITNSDEFYKK